VAKTKSAAPKPAPKSQNFYLITDIELLALETNRETLKMLVDRVSAAKKAIEAMEDDLILRLERGARPVGEMTALIQTVKGQCRPAWKDIMVAHMHDHHGVVEASTVAVAQAQTTIPTSKQLVIGKKGGLRHD
jgi:hypothetical protein